MKTFQYSIIPLLQLFREYQLGATPLLDIIDLVKGVANQMKAEPAWFNQIVRPASHFMRENLVTIISQSHAHAFA